MQGKRKETDDSNNSPAKLCRRDSEKCLNPVNQEFLINEKVINIIMFCWGSTLHGELGLGGLDHDHVMVPQELLFNEVENVIQVSCGNNHTVLLTKDGKIFSCGNNDHGQLGHDKRRTIPGLVDGLDAYKMSTVCCGGSHTLAFNEWGQLFGWGSDAFGQLSLSGEPQSTPKIVRSLATAHIVQVACGQTHSLALTNGGELYVWGGNGHGQLGLGKRGSVERVPQLVTSLIGVPIAFIACGAYHSFAVSKSGAVFGWGCNNEGQLGLNDTDSRQVPSQLATHRSFKIKYVACGEDFSVFLTSDGGVFTCGAGNYGQLGHGSTSRELLPRKVLELMGSTVTQVSCGRRHTLALVPSRGRVYAFGLGGSGQLGTRSSSNSVVPQVVLGPWVSPSGVALVDSPTSGNSIVTNIYSGGDQSFVTVAKVEECRVPDDRRVLNESSQIWTISSDKIAQCRKIPFGMTVDQDLIAYLEVVFRSASCLNGSFLLENDGHSCCSDTNHGVDISRAKNLFSEIACIENESIKDVILSGITESLIPSISNNSLDPEAFRTYLVLPFYHNFDNPKLAERLHGPFARKVLSLNDIGLKTLGRWWTNTSPEYFERLVRVYKNVVACTLSQIDKKDNKILFDDAVMDSLNILKLLNFLNNAVDELLVPYNTFYLPELNDVIDVRQDYVEWLRYGESRGRRIFFCNYSFLFDVNAKTSLLQADQILQMHNAMQEATMRSLTLLLFGTQEPSEVNFLSLTVSRDDLVNTTISQLMSFAPNDLKKPLKVKFFGEEAEDGGGVRKEFFLLIMREVLDPKYGMFKNQDETNTIWFNDMAFEDDNTMYSFIGLLCGLAIYNFTIIDLPFPLALYKKLLQEKVSYQDLKGLSPTMFKSFQSLLDYTGDDLEDVFSFTFEISQEVYGEVKNIELKDGGSRIAVTQLNKKEFVDLYADYILNKSIKNQFEAFSTGFKKVCDGKILYLFRSEELMGLVVGNENYDWEVFEKNAEYKGGYTADDPTIRLFWEVFHELSHDEKKMFLLFLTGTDRIPMQGMKVVKIVIQPTHDDKYLPVAHTCFNLLDLPRYQTKERLRYKLLNAIKQYHGFSLV